MDSDQKLCFVEMKVMVICSHNAKSCTMNDELLPLPKWLYGNKIPMFAPDFVVPLQSVKIGDFPAYFPTTVGSVYALTKHELANLSYFYNDDFGVTNPDASRRVLVNAFMKFVQGQCLHKA
ncbi:hypothetical protein THRCLA_08492 [Thraustotheca clavata]|uniref:Uncharacterized protein n=1 Tax=Thraustotheca clavata TaxID=74557 RepID=A0A1V9Z5Y3_9STRA|nr:hypothetical protein THRCLA_08492 [Thraustotheca clavata]